MSQIELFNYDDLTPDVQTEIKLASERIKMRMKRTAEDIVEIGKELIAVKSRLPHGQFLPWIQAEFEMSRVTAFRFMQVAEKFGSQMFHHETFSPTVLFELSSPSTPDEVVEQAIKKAESGESVTVAEVKDLKAQVVAAKKENEKLFRDFSLQREKLSKTEKEKQQAIAQALREKEAYHNQAMQELQMALMKDIEAKAKEAEAEKKRLEQFKSNPDPETSKKAKEAQELLTKRKWELQQAEAKLEKLRTKENNATAAVIKLQRFKGAIEKLIGDHADGLIELSSPYLPESCLMEMETAACALEDLAHKIRTAGNQSWQSRSLKSVDVEVL